jgi:hypothetical protein
MLGMLSTNSSRASDATQFPYKAVLPCQGLLLEEDEELEELLDDELLCDDDEEEEDEELDEDDDEELDEEELLDDDDDDDDDDELLLEDEDELYAFSTHSTSSISLLPEILLWFWPSEELDDEEELEDELLESG